MVKKFLFFTLFFVFNTPAWAITSSDYVQFFYQPKANQHAVTLSIRYGTMAIETSNAVTTQESGFSSITFNAQYEYGILD